MSKTFFYFIEFTVHNIQRHRTIHDYIHQLDALFVDYKLGNLILNTQLTTMDKNENSHPELH